VTALPVVAVAAIVLGAGLLCQVVAEALRVPPMLLLLGAGLVLGPSGASVISIPLDSPGAKLVLGLGVGFILFHGGLELSVRVLHRVAGGLVLLAVPGVIATAAIVGAVAAAVFHLPLLTGLLIGAVLAPTDPAILIPLFERLRVRPKVAQTVIAESALNDPTAAVLALVLAGGVVGGGASLDGALGRFLEELAISSAAGCVAGVLLAWALSRRSTLGESAALVAMAGVAAVVSGTDAIGGSGYLGAFLAGLVVGNMDQLGLAMHGEHEQELRSFVGTIAQLVVLTVFVVLGANLPLRVVSSHAAGAVAVVATLVFVARPLVVAAALALDRRGRWTAREVVFVAATRETGVMATALGALLVSLRVPGADVVLACVTVAVLVTVGGQATLKPWLARRLALTEAGGDPEYEEAAAIQTPAVSSAADPRATLLQATSWR
jgi:NhaP-type Na+/H+ or K+/H+ antiporter